MTMGINEWLHEMNNLVARSQDSSRVTAMMLATMAEDMAKTFDRINAHLTDGGELPDSWKSGWKTDEHGRLMQSSEASE